MEHTEWVSSIVVVPNKNEKLKICVNLKKLNEQIVKDHFPLPFTKVILEALVRDEAYSYLDAFLKYNQILIIFQD